MLKRGTDEYRKYNARKNREWRLANPERYAATKLKHKHKASAATKKCRDKKLAKNPVLSLWWSARTRARIKNITFNIDVEDVVVPEFCPVLGVKLRIGVGAFDPCGASIDRIKPELGYIKGNIQVISMRANKIKSDASLEELEAVTKYLHEQIHGPVA